MRALLSQAHFLLCGAQVHWLPVVQQLHAVRFVWRRKCDTVVL